MTQVTTLSAPQQFVQNELSRLVIKRGALAFLPEPPEIRWNGVTLRLSPLETEILSLLVRRGRASWEDVDSAITALHGNPHNREIFIHRIRSKFAAIGAADPVETVRGWGLRLRVERDLFGSTTTWIGARTDAIDAFTPEAARAIAASSAAQFGQSFGR